MEYFTANTPNAPWNKEQKSASVPANPSVVPNGGGGYPEALYTPKPLPAKLPAVVAEPEAGMGVGLREGRQAPAAPPENEGLAGPPMGLGPAREMPEILDGGLRMNGFLRTQIGRVMRLECLIGEAVTDRLGRLCQVGEDYLLLQGLDGNVILCDLPSVRFATIVPAAD